ncbi:GlcNAc-transferase family protein [Scandinavium sp.]|uniref:GlcNAc-transferase family protein n=1 Tax=Scandinavium sp. TaxID=2830653 RepID=UPI00289B2335|nr:GlcNAc-transferase family protein [Scandinavium sp.]
MTESRTLFVSIACYRDPELIPTLQSLIDEAQYPQNLHIAVCWQDDNPTSALFTDAGMQLVEERVEEDHTLFRFHWRQVQLEVIAVDYRHSQGACWARYMAETRFADEDFTLQIDSHCRFIHHWDGEMIAMLEGLRRHSEKPVLSTYPPAYDPQDDPAKRGQFVSRLIFREFSKEGLPMLSSVPVKSEQPVRGSYIAGGFLFAGGRFVREVANDPQIFFAGEEIAMAARAWTHGYDIYTPHKILLWHYYGRKQANKIWGDHTREAKNVGEVAMGWWERDAISKKRIRSLFDLEIVPVDPGIYGLGSARSLRDFGRLIGVDFKRRAVLPEVLGAEKTSVFPPESWPDDEQWVQRLISPFRKTVTLKKEAVAALMPTTDWWYLGVYSAGNRLMDEKKLSPEALEKSLNISKNDEFSLDIQFSTAPRFDPAVVRLCPFSESGGWGEVLEKPW